MSRPLRSISTASNNVLLRVVVPKRTGRRRKRGSSEAFTDAPATDGEAQDASHMQRTLQDNVGKYRVEAIGMVDRTHVFRGRYALFAVRNIIVLTDALPLNRYARFCILDSRKPVHE